jgi:hypothetical protein
LKNLTKIALHTTLNGYFSLKVLLITYLQKPRKWKKKLQVLALMLAYLLFDVADQNIDPDCASRNFEATSHHAIQTPLATFIILSTIFALSAVARLSFRLYLSSVFALKLFQL